jgi:hypothetical protein
MPIEQRYIGTGAAVCFSYDDRGGAGDKVQRLMRRRLKADVRCATPASVKSSASLLPTEEDENEDCENKIQEKMIDVIRSKIVMINLMK